MNWGAYNLFISSVLQKTCVIGSKFMAKKKIQKKEKISSHLGLKMTGFLFYVRLFYDLAYF